MFMLEIWEASILFIIGTLIFPFTFLLQRLWWTKTSSGLSVASKYGLTTVDTVDISNKVVSSLQAICAGISGTIVCKNCLHDVLHSTDPMSIIYAWFGIPYFVYDTFCMYYVYQLSLPETLTKESFVKKFFKFILHSPVIFTHHMIMAPVGWTLIVFFRDEFEPGDFFVGIIYMMEWSTPFVSLRFILSKLKMKSSPWYAVNGLVMFVTFFIFRLGSVYYAAFLLSVQNNYKSLFQALLSIPLLWKIVWITAVLPQIYWWILMWRGIIKTFLQAKVSNQPDKTKESSTATYTDLPNNSSQNKIKDLKNIKRE